MARKLTDKGFRLLVESGVSDYIDHNKNALITHFDTINHPFDIQEKAMTLMREKILESDDIKDYIFYNLNSGIHTDGVGEVAEVGAIKLRDIVMKHKGLWKQKQ